MKKKKKKKVARGLILTCDLKKYRYYNTTIKALNEKYCRKSLIDKQSLENMKRKEV